jgi:hypothetical protein
MDYFQQVYEFMMLLESMEMPDHLRTALVETFQHTSRSNKPMSEEEIQMRLDILEKGNKRAGLPFDRAATEKDMHDHPGKYSRMPIPKRPMDTNMMMHNSQLNMMSPAEARKKYYKAAVNLVSEIYKNYQIPFDDVGNLQYLDYFDSTGYHKEFDYSTANSVVFRSILDATENPVMMQLTRENRALRLMLSDCKNFLKGLREARAKGTSDMYIMNQQQAAADKGAPQLPKPNADLTEIDQRAFDAREAAQKAKETAYKGPSTVASRAICIGDMRKSFPKMPYAQLYEKFAKSADPEKLESAPKPGESVSQYIYRVHKGGISLGMFIKLRARDIAAAYPPNAVQSALSSIQSWGYEPSAARKADELIASGEIPETIKPVAMLCISLWSVREYAESSGQQIYLP